MAYIYKGPRAYIKGGFRFGNNTGIFNLSGAPTSGTSGSFANIAGPGAIILSANKNIYINTNTKASPTWSIVPNEGTSSLPAVLANVTTAAPTLTTSATYVHMGLGATASITPVLAGRIAFTITGDIASTNGQSATTQLSFGSGSAPTNGTAFTGTQVGSQVVQTALTGYLVTPFSLTAVVTGLVVGTAYWLDLVLKSSSGNATVTTVSVSAMEI
jgi:hypothetical protein